MSSMAKLSLVSIRQCNQRSVYNAWQITTQCFLIIQLYCVSGCRGTFSILNNVSAIFILYAIFKCIYCNTPHTESNQIQYIYTHKNLLLQFLQFLSPQSSSSSSLCVCVHHTFRCLSTGRTHYFSFFFVWFVKCKWEVYVLNSRLVSLDSIIEMARLMICDFFSCCRN